MCRDKALATISADGILLVLASMNDNMPYVLAEASVMRIPLLIYDVGGVTEMIDPKQHADIICGTPKVGSPPGSCNALRACGSDQSMQGLHGSFLDMFFKLAEATWNLLHS